MYTITIENNDTKIIAIRTFKIADAETIHNFVDFFFDFVDCDPLDDDDDDDDYIDEC